MARSRRSEPPPSPPPAVTVDRAARLCRLVSLLGHAFLILDARRWISQALQTAGKGRLDQAPSPKPYSGLHRYFTHVKKD